MPGVVKGVVKISDIWQAPEELRRAHKYFSDTASRTVVTGMRYTKGADPELLLTTLDGNVLGIRETPGGYVIRPVDDKFDRRDWSTREPRI
ncbi:MAG: hypothetical protein HYU56_03195 [Candidatus Aenigmarchaeota archaeon]|nr:hypothetical protein [Candidatus Aenigmarchaeota archaeon]